MKLEMGWEDLLYYAEGCARGSHLRQHVWQRFVDNIYPLLDDKERESIYVYAKRDISLVYAPHGDNGYRHFGYDDFELFLSCYNPDNRYLVTPEYGGSIDCFLHDGRYFTSFNSWMYPPWIKKVEKITKPRRLNDDGTACV